MKSLIKVLLINMAVIGVIFVFAEIGLRAYSTAKTCLSGECDGSLFSRFHLLEENHMLGISKRDPVLGYKPNPGFSGIVHLPPGWDKVYVSIDQDGFRRNTDDTQVREHSGKKVLTVGDSFTFGDQVKNSDTWPACVAQKTGFDVWNGGVFGYGGAQAVLRAKQEIGKHGPFEIVIWAITVVSDFPRDQLEVRSDFPKPHIATVDGETFMVPPGDFDPSWDPMWLLGYSVILKRYLLPILENQGNFSYDGRYKIPGVHAAEIDEVIDYAFNDFVGLPGAKRKVVLLEYTPWIFWEKTFERNNERRKLIKKYAEKYHIEIIDSFDQVYIPEKKAELWFGYLDFGHHTPYGNRVVCDEVVHWLAKDTPR